MTKTQIMQLIAAGVVREAFTVEFDGTFDVTAIREDCKNGLFGDPVRLDWYPVQARIVEALIKYRGIEEARVRYFINLGLEKTREDPVINVKIPLRREEKYATTTGEELDPNQPADLFIDGVHRLCALWLLKSPYVLMYCVPIEKAKRPDPSFLSLPTLDWGEPDFLQKRGIKT